MLKWAFVFLLIAIVAGIFGFTGVEQASATIAQWLFGIFLVLFVGALAIGALARRRADELDVHARGQRVVLDELRGAARPDRPSAWSNSTLASSTSLMRTCSSERALMSSVVSHSCSGFISPRPL